jgi:hypothetical protein
MLKVLPTYTINKLNKAINTNPPSFLFKHEVALGFLELIYYRTKIKDKKDKDERYKELNNKTNLCDKYLKKYHDSRKKYFDYLRINKLIHRGNYKAGARCFDYSLVISKEELIKLEVEIIDLTETSAGRKFVKFNEYEWNKSANKHAKHLKEWFNGGLKVDVVKGEQLIKNVYKETSKN